MGAPPQSVTDVIRSARPEGLHKKGTVSILSNGDGSFRVTPDKRTVERQGQPDEAEQWVDEQRGLVLIDIGGTLSEGNR